MKRPGPGFEIVIYQSMSTGMPVEDCFQEPDAKAVCAGCERHLVEFHID